MIAELTNHLWQSTVFAILVHVSPAPYSLTREVVIHGDGVNYA